MRNLTMLMDYYELTMAEVYFKEGKNDIAVFDMFTRKVPDKGGFIIAAGLEQFIDYVLKMHFNEDDLAYLRSYGFSEEFLDYLKNFKFTGNIYALEEGTICYPNTPIVTIEAPLIEAQLIETMLLLTINHQSLIATKANRIVRAAKGRSVMEFGARRAHSYDAAVYGSRASFIGGIKTTATTLASELFKIKAVGTMAHSFVQSFASEYEAFKTYALNYPDSCTLLIDTYDIMKGLENAIKVHFDCLVPKGKALKAVRIDSGDLAYFSKKVRMRLDEVGLTDVKIVVSNSIDEYLIESLFAQGAQIDSFGVGERLITAKSEPVFGGVYKLAAIKENGHYVPKIKISENVEKVTNPGFKKLYRIYNKDGLGLFDVLALKDEVLTSTTKLVAEDKPYKRYEIGDNLIKELQVEIIKNGKLVYEFPKLEEISQKVIENLACVFDEEKRFEYPHQHYVDLTEDLYNLKSELLKE